MLTMGTPALRSLAWRPAWASKGVELLSTAASGFAQAAGQVLDVLQVAVSVERDADRMWGVWHRQTADRPFLTSVCLGSHIASQWVEVTGGGKVSTRK